jgi:hypothetical protein
MIEPMYAFFRASASFALGVIEDSMQTTYYYCL